MRKVITFEKEMANDILNLFNKTVDDSGYIVEKDNIDQKVLTIDGEELKIEDFAGIRPGSEIFIKSDLISIINLAGILS